MIEILNQYGGILSGQLAKLLATKHHISVDAAKKRIERISSPVHKITGCFSDRQSFVYLDKKYNSSEYFDALFAAIHTDAKQYFYIIKALENHFGFVRQNDLASYSVYPVIDIKGHVTFSTAIKKLDELNIISRTDSDYYELTKLGFNGNYLHSRGVELSKVVLVDQVEEWAKKLGLSSYSAGKRNNQINGFQFIYTAPTYVQGLVQFNPEKLSPGFFVVDALIGRRLSSEDIEFFLNKINIVKRICKGRIFPMLLVDSLEENALAKLKKAGVIIGFVSVLFGDKFSALLNQLIALITNAGAILMTNPDSYIRTMDELKKLVEGKTNNLRGDLFEMAVGLYYSQKCNSLEIGKIINVVIDGQMKKAEIDVCASLANEGMVCVECKGYGYPFNEEETLEFLNKKIPRIRQWWNELLQKQFVRGQLTIEIWCTGGFTEKAIELLEKAKGVKKYQFNYFDKASILEKAKNFPKLNQILREYYMKDI